MVKDNRPVLISARIKKECGMWFNKLTLAQIIAMARLDAAMQ